MKTPTTLRELNDVYQELFFLEDKSIIPLLATIIINAKTKLPPVWLYLIGASSSGKSAALSVFSGVKFVNQISDFTPNTLLSGARSHEKETSLLLKLGKDFVVVMKDFTTILSKSEETQQVLMGQLREVYDGHMVKFTGLGDKIEWGDKMKPYRSVFIMAATEAIYKAQEKFSDMGSRGLNYVFKDQDRIATTKMSLKKSATYDSTLAEIQGVISEYIIRSVTNLPTEFKPIPEEVEDEIIEVADFVTQARSIVLRDYRGSKSLALSAEFPMRVAKQMVTLATLMQHLNGGELTDEDKAAVYKCGFDCIPKQSKLALETLASHYRIDDSGLAEAINYPKLRAKEWAENLNMFKIIDRVRMDKKEYWEMKTKWRNLLKKYWGIDNSGDILTGRDDDDWFTSNYGD